MKRFVLVLYILLASLSSFAAEVSGYGAVEDRHFFKHPLYSGQKRNNGLSFIFEPEIYHVSKDEKHTYTGKFFWRYDHFDKKRTHFDIRQLDWIYAHDDYELQVGVSKVFWGVLESRHLVDIINQDDALEDIKSKEKLGQPLIKFAKFTDSGTFNLFYMPYFRERAFPGKYGRHRAEYLVDTNNPRYPNAKKEWYPSFALRYEKVVGLLDIGLAYFHGLSREPNLQFSYPYLLPEYKIINQLSADVQLTCNNWLGKLEAIVRQGQGRKFLAVSTGVEYTFYSIFNKDIDLGYLVEYHYDGRDKTAPATIYSNDVFLGGRFSLNDAQSSEILGGILITKDATKFYSIEASTRLPNNWKLELQARIIADAKPKSALYHTRNDSFFLAKLSYYF